LTWQLGLGLPVAAPMQGDANGDGIVNGRDLAAWKFQFNGRSAALPGVVPETNSLATCASAMFVWFLFVRQRLRSVS
jgi:hypothetical protein